MIRRILRFIGKVVLAIFGFVAVYLLVMFGLSRIQVNSVDKDPKQEIAIYIKSNGVHTDIVIPIETEFKDWADHTKIENTRAKDSLYRYVAFGWGDHDFYLNTPEWSDLILSTALNAAFYRGTGLMHVGFYRQLTENQNCKKIMISKSEFQKLITFIESSFITDESGNLLLIENESYGDNDNFYRAVGKYNLFYTCNSWANNALRNSDQKAALWTVNDTGIFYHYQ